MSLRDRTISERTQAAAAVLWEWRASTRLGLTHVGLAERALEAADKADAVRAVAQRLAFEQPDDAMPGAWDLEEIAYVRRRDLDALREVLGR